jgi:cell division protein ZapE
MLRRNRESSPSPLRSQYEALLGKGELTPDPAQAQAIAVLESLAENLAGYKPAGRGLFAGLRKPPERQRGLYIYGDVGRGKSMLMDLFFDGVQIAKKRRVHFHQFMLEVHARLFRMQGEADDILPRVARDIAKDAWLLCFDEFHVGNIADAMILGRLFESLFDNGVVIVATSNWPPDDLYKGGLQRDRFLPFIDLIKRHMDVHRLAGATDHRYEKMHGMPNYFTPLGADATAKLQKIFTQVAGGAAVKPLQLPVQGRTVIVPRAAKDVAFFNFIELCDQPYGAADYLAMAECFHTILIDKVPQLQPDQRDVAARFVTLIDALYEAKVKLFIAAAASPEQLCVAGAQSFAFQRTASRLAEMQSEEYRQQAHLG